jgi:hypothetical protein
MEKENTNMHESGADRTGSDRFKENDSHPKDVREAEDNIRQAQGDDATGPAVDRKSGNRPRFDRDR